MYLRCYYIEKVPTHCLWLLLSILCLFLWCLYYVSVYFLLLVKMTVFFFVKEVFIGLTILTQNEDAVEGKSKVKSSLYQS